MDQIQLGLINQRNGWHAKAAACFRLALEADPKSLAAQLLLISALIDTGKADAAASALDAVLADRRWDPSSDREAGPALTALGASFRGTDRLADAVRCFAAAAEVLPDDATAQQRLGILLLLLSQPEPALLALDRAAALDPYSAETHHNRGVALATLGRETEATLAFSRALEINPEHVQARAQRMFIMAGENDWATLADDLEWLPDMGTTRGVVSPFAMMSFEDHPERHKLRSMRYAATQCPVAVRGTGAPVPARPKSKPAKIRLGYFSADFRNHAMVHLAGRMFELHDRDRFETHAFAFGPPTDDLQRKRMIRAFDHFTAVEAMSDEQIAAKARADGIHIAIDLLGYTKGDRAGIFARRPAPVQINYLGFPGTSGAPFIDYLIADPVVIAPDHRDCYTEKLITLPFTYQPTDNRTAISARRFTRQQQGLPDAGFVFCCFNQRYKIKPAEYAIWMRLLTEVDGSVLWLLAGSSTSRDNLRAAAVGHGVDPGRLRFAEPLPVAEHLARIRLADLFVDCFHYNAHTTAMDALWVGLPLVTKIGSGFATRVAASLLGAVGLSELVTSSDSEYFELALELARDPARLGSIRDRLEANRSIMPMFDTEQYTRHIEAGYEAAYQRYFDGLAPADIWVDA